MAVLLLPSEKLERTAIMSKKDKTNKTDHDEDFNLNENENIEQEVEQEKEQVDDALALLQDEFKREKDRYLRLFAEFENYKKRTSRERMEMFKTAGEDIVLSLLPVLDDFERALKEIDKGGDEGLYKGVELIYNKLRETLRAKGLEMIEVKPGDSFDAETHEAITQVPAPEKKYKGKILDIVENGYSLGGKIIRYPKVVMGQ